jgi:hypothetical protein
MDQPTLLPARRIGPDTDLFCTHVPLPGLGVGKLGLHQLPLERTWLLNPGQALDVGNRRLLALRPPVYDAPETMALFDTHTRHLFSSDCFGAVLAKAAESAAEVTAAELREGLALWATIDAPWLAQLDRKTLAAACLPWRDLRPQRVLSSHLPPAEELEELLYSSLDSARERTPFVGPDQQAFEQAIRLAEPALA